MSLRKLIEAVGLPARNLLILFAVAAALQACGQNGPARASCPEGKVCLHLGNVSEPNSLDPHKSSGVSEDRIISDSLMGLTQDDPQGKPIPGMAERWETSADGLTWRFYLREAQWSDGTPVTAEDFVFSIRRILDPKTASQYSSILYMIDGAQAANEGKQPLETVGVRAVSPRILEFRLNHPAPYLPEVAKHYSMYPVPRHVVQKWGDAWTRPEHFVGNGPFVIREWRLGDYVRSVKNPRFFEASRVCADEVYYYPTNDAITAERRVRRGELDANFDIQSNRIAFLRKEIPDYVHTHTYLGVAYVAFNSTRPEFRDPRVRRALSMAIDREFIAEKLLRGGQTPAYTFVPPGVANYQGAKPPEWVSWPLEKRQAEARRLLAAAGHGPDRPLLVEIKHRKHARPDAGHAGHSGRLEGHRRRCAPGPERDPDRLCVLSGAGLRRRRRRLDRRLQRPDELPLSDAVGDGAAELRRLRQPSLRRPAGQGRQRAGRCNARAVSRRRREADAGGYGGRADLLLCHKEPGEPEDQRLRRQRHRSPQDAIPVH
jgi:oligopeptide transport system substrate-binding protein